MNLINPNSVEGYVNHFADRLLSFSDNSNHSKFVVTFYYNSNLLIISGLNSSKDIFNLHKIHSDFLEEFPMYEDIIFFNKEMKIVDLTNQHKFSDNVHLIDSYWFTFHNTPRPLYSHFQISEFVSPSDTKKFPEYNHLSTNEIHLPRNPRETIISGPPIHGDGMFVSSSYPFGHSKYLRYILYTAEFFAYNLFRATKTDTIQIFNNQITPQWVSNEFSIRCKSKHSEKNLVSMALDVLGDYDLMSVVQDYNIEDDFFKPVSDKPWLEAWNVGELVIF